MSQQSGTRTVLNWGLPGLIAGLVFAMWAMVVGLFTSTLWAPPQGIAQSIGIGSPGHNFQLDWAIPCGGAQSVLVKD